MQTATYTLKQRKELDRAQLEAQRCAYRDSNDNEIESLRDALDLALSLIGGEWRQLSEKEIDKLTA